MKKFKKFCTENKIIIVLALIVLICIIIMGFISIRYFYGTSKSVYGDRLQDLVPFSDTTKTKVISTLEKNENVDTVSLTVKGRIVYININYKDNVSMDNGKKIASSVLELFSEEELSNYDLSFTIASKSSSNDGTSYTLMGAKNASGSESIVWSNFTQSSSENESGTKK